MEDYQYQPPDRKLPSVDEMESATSVYDAPPEVSTQKINEKKLALQAIEKQPEVILDKVAKAAQEGRPQEKLYELRHEVKDEPSTQAPTSVGNIVAGTPMRQPGLTPIRPLPQAPTFTREEQAESPSRLVPQSLYRQAIQSGFISAVILLSVFLVLMLIF